jgi:hypothetical protein
MRSKSALFESPLQISNLVLLFPSSLVTSRGDMVLAHHTHTHTIVRVSQEEAESERRASRDQDRNHEWQEEQGRHREERMVVHLHPAC